MAKALRASGSGIFTLLPSGEVTIDPRSTAILASFELRWIFKAVGIYMAKALLDGYTLGISLSPLFLSLLCDKSPSMEDLAACEPHYHNGLQYVLNNDVSGEYEEISLSNLSSILPSLWDLSFISLSISFNSWKKMSDLNRFLFFRNGIDIFLLL